MIQHIEIEFRTVEERFVRILEEWKEREGPMATYMRLIEILSYYGRSEVAVEVCRILKAASLGLY